MTKGTIKAVEDAGEGQWVAFLENGKPAIGLTTRKRGKASYVVEIGGNFARRAHPDGAVYLLGPHEITIDPMGFQPDGGETVGSILLMGQERYLIFVAAADKLLCIDLSNFEAIDVPGNRADFVATRWSVAAASPQVKTLITMNEVDSDI